MSSNHKGKPVVEKKTGKKGKGLNNLSFKLFSRIRILDREFNRGDFADMMVLQHQIGSNFHGSSSMLVVIGFLVDCMAVKEHRPYKSFQFPIQNIKTEIQRNPNNGTYLDFKFQYQYFTNGNRQEGSKEALSPTLYRTNRKKEEDGNG